MIKIKNYKKVENLEEAWELNQKRTEPDYWRYALGKDE